jgi:uncharacterized repeat protein (TIGR03803 family)
MRLRRIAPARAYAIVFAVALISSVQAQVVSVFRSYSFHLKPDGAEPYAAMIADGNGNLYGTTRFGGVFGNGTVFKVAPTGTETVLYSFTGATDGALPQAGLAGDAAGNLYGTTSNGGADGQGTVFELDATRTETVLHAFTGRDGAVPSASLIRDAAGNLYGTTSLGGAHHHGTVFKMNPAGREVMLFSFAGPPTDGANPVASLIRDEKGNLYGTASLGGTFNHGAVFKISRTGAESLLYSFAGGADGAQPSAALIRDSAGNFYGTTVAGGLYNVGTVFKLNAAGTETLLYTFTGLADGGQPFSSLIQDAAGNLYGTTLSFGAGCGVIFEVDQAGKETVLHAFGAVDPGCLSLAGLIQDAAGNFYGTTLGGDFQSGTVFKFTP